jgi:hypothetical protein
VWGRGALHLDLLWKPKRNRLLGRLRSTWVNDIKMNLKWDGTGLICFRIGTRDGPLRKWQ